MITISAALKAHLALETQTRAMLWKVTLANGTIRGFTNCDIDIVFNDGAGAVTYATASGYSRSDIQTGAALEVDAMEVQGFLQSPSITEADLAAGVWDFAAIKISIVNYRDLTQGELIYRVGTIGEVTQERGTFKAELHGKTKKYLRVIGDLTSPSCRTTLGSALCTVDLAPLTVTSALTGVSTDGRTLFDTARTEPGPSTGVAITNITKANPGVVTLAAPLGLPTGAAVMMSEIVGMTQANTSTVAHNVAVDGLTFEIGDTTTFSTYVSGGKVRELGSGASIYDNGVITMTSGLNNGLRREVQSYVPGQMMLELPFPYPLAIGDTYSMHQGCGYSFFSDCRDRFSNAVNFQGEPFVGGTDKLMQVGRVQ